MGASPYAAEWPPRYGVTAMLASKRNNVGQRCPSGARHHTVCMSALFFRLAEDRESVGIIGTNGQTQEVFEGGWPVGLLAI